VTDNDSEARTCRRRHRQFTDDYSYHVPAAKYDDPSSPSRPDYRNTADDQPLPAMYFEPSSNNEYFQPVAEPTWDGLGYAMVQNRGVQNVPSMATIGIQYAIDQNGTAVPTGTVPVGGVGVPSFYLPAGIQHAADVACHEPGLPIRRTPGGTLPPGSAGGSSFYQPPPSYGTRPVAITGRDPSVPVIGAGVADGQPVVVGGSSCPLCGHHDYHVHSDAVVVSSTNNAVPHNVASGGTVPQVTTVTPRQTTFLTRYKRFTFLLRYFLPSFCRTGLFPWSLTTLTDRKLQHQKRNKQALNVDGNMIMCRSTVYVCVKNGEIGLCRNRNVMQVKNSQITTKTLLPYFNVSISSRDGRNRWIKEAVNIRKEGHRAMNRDEGSYQLSHAYDRFLDVTDDCHIKTRRNCVPASSDEDSSDEIETSK